MSPSLFLDSLLLSGNGLLLAFPGAGVGSRPLSSYRQALSMSQPTITAYIHEPFDVQGNFRPKTSFYLVLVLDYVPEFTDFFGRKIVRFFVRIDFRLFADLFGRRSSYTEDIGQSHIEMLVGKVNTSNTSHEILLPLSLLMFRILANDPQNAAPLDYFAFFANRTNTHPYFHTFPRLQIPGPDLAAFYKSLVMMHFQMPFYLRHRIQVYTDHDQQ